MGRLIQKFLCAENGATAIEYGIIASTIFIVIMATVLVLGQKLTGLYQAVADAFST